eukprot:ANDGO_03576.mRNA.1 hypothetical protein
MRVLTAISFGALFLSASAGILLSGLILAEDNPWEMNKAYDYDHILQTFDQTALREIMYAHYRFISLTLYLAAALVLLIIFAAPKSRPLIFLTLATVCVYMTALQQYFEPIPKFEDHRRLFWAAYASNMAGLVAYTLHLIYRWFRGPVQKPKQS